jgi:hypothetical protein
VKAVLDAAFLLAMSGWVGSLLFVTSAVLLPARAPGDPEVAGRPALAGLLRRLYAWGATCGAIALPASLGAPLAFPEYRSPWVGAEALLIIAATLAMFYGGNSLVPALERATVDPAGDPRRAAGRIGRAAGINLAVAAIGAVLVVAFVLRPAPATSGIVEPTPRERARRAFEAAERAGRGGQWPLGTGGDRPID